MNDRRKACENKILINGDGTRIKSAHDFNNKWIVKNQLAYLVRDDEQEAKKMIRIDASPAGIASLLPFDLLLAIHFPRN